jgi:hypothetical protein
VLKARFPVIAVKVIFIWKNIKITLFYFLKFILSINILKLLKIIKKINLK